MPKRPSPELKSPRTADRVATPSARFLGVLLAALFVLASAVLPASTADAQDSASTPDTPSAPSEGLKSPRPLDPTSHEASLARVLAGRSQIEDELRKLQDELESDDARGREAEIKAEIGELSRQHDDLMRSFSELASGVDPLSIEPDESANELELTREVRDLLGPLVNELKRATSRPREIDRLRTEISNLADRLNQVTFALNRLDELSATVSEPSVAAALAEEQNDWTRRRSALSTEIQIAQQKLDRRMGENQSIAEAVENLFQLFFKSRGRNLLFALLATLGFLLVIRRLRTLVANQRGVSQKAQSFEGRVMALLYSAFSVIGAILVFLVALYFFGDWVLLILMLLLILGIIWTSKQAIPRFWSQAVLILDMGSVREGERVIYNGLAWRIESISFYSILENPALVGGTLRLPIDDLGELRSRAFREDEAFFPTKEGDVILLPDGRPAEVEFQSIDAVRLRLPGETRTIVPTRDFVAQPIEKLSAGYRVDIQFGLDYGDQGEITTSMREFLERRVEDEWQHSKWSDSFVSTSVEFKEAGASSLDYFVRVDLDGSAAFDFQAQKRALARICVDVCNERGWTIPFTQLTLHVAEGSGSGGKASVDRTD